MMKKKIFSILLTSVCFIIILQGVLNILKPKGGSGIYDLKEFYQLESNTVDVLMLGSSLSFINIDPAVLWNKYGIAAYSLGGAVQPLWNTYYYLREALKTQSPQLITLEVYCAQEEYNPDNNYVLNNIVAIRDPVNRFKAVLCSTTKEQWAPMFLGVPNYHDRYRNLSKEDFLPYRGQKDFEYYLGHGTYYKTKACMKPDIANNISEKQLPVQSEKYLRKIIELCMEKNVDLLLFASPTALYHDLCSSYLSVKKIAEEYNISYKDFNLCYDDVGLIFEKDYADENHLNQNGCPKFSSFFADYIKSHYILCNHTGEAAYERWDNADLFRKKMEYDYCLTVEDTLLEEFEHILSSGSNSLRGFLWVTGEESEYIQQQLKEYGISENRGLYNLCDGHAQRITGEVNIDVGADVFTIDMYGAIKNLDRIFNADGTALFCIDTFLNKMVDAVYFNGDGTVRSRPDKITWTWVGTGD